MRRGFTLIEVVLAALTLVVTIAAIVGAYVGQNVLNEHARNLSLATQDANRVLERIRQENAGAGCSVDVVPPPGFSSWNAWLADTTSVGGGGKSIQPIPALNELVVVTCQDRDGGATSADYCGGIQMGTGEWAAGSRGRQAASTTFDPLRVTVAVCWRHRNRIIGECAANGAGLSPSDTDNDGLMESPAILTTLVTCRG